MITRILPGRRDLLAPTAAFPQRYPCLLESAARGTAQARWDILFAFPQATLRLDADGAVRDGGDRVIGARFLDALDAAWRAERQSGAAGDDPALPSVIPAQAGIHLPSRRRGSTLDSRLRGNDDNGGDEAWSDDLPDLPFTGGWVLYLGYELAGEIEPRLRLPAAPEAGVPTALALRCPAAAIVDHARRRTVLVAEAGHAALLDALESDLAAAAAYEMPALPVASIEEDAPQRFLDGVARIHCYLRSGDTFQVNLSREWCARFADAPAPAALHAALRRANPAPFAGLLQWRDWAIASSSPERLVEVRGDAVQTRPIAGTRPRFAGDDDTARVRELVGHPKERAEHVMLIDLERNDLGRVCVPGSVRVDELMTVESYAHVHHIVSNVRGTLRAGTTPGEVIAATFPGGTITGCPKVRCMEIIAELEGVGRGPYTGALGYLDRSGDLDLNILIRSALLRGEHARLRAGAGIVADSDATRELEETRHKARGLLRALGAAG